MSDSPSETTIKANTITEARVSTLALEGLIIGDIGEREIRTLKVHDWNKGLPLWLEAICWAMLAGGVLWAIL